MSTLKKILALSLALAMILSVSVFAGNYSADTYKDAAAIDKDAAESVELLYALKVMTGDEKGNFNPNATITRAEVAKMIYVILNYGKDDKAVNYAAANLFTDVPATAWYAGYINYLAAMGLVNGSEGKFYPTNPVKTAEAAKMLLTAIGYNSEARQYVGANWAKNVLSDASIVGLLGGYKADINGAAPRQWVAVMFNNALLKAYTFNTVVPSGYNGIFGTTGSGAVAGTDKFIKFGEKFYGLETFTGYLFATDSAYIDVLKSGEKTDDSGNDVPTANSGRVIFAKESGAKGSGWIQVKNPGLGYMDLGQEYRVIYKDGGNTVYSACLTGESVVAESRLQDITVDMNYKTDNNEADNKYVFTVDGETFKLPKVGKAVYELAVYPQDNEGTTMTTKHTINNSVIKATVNKVGEKAKKLPMTAKVIDADGNGTVDYVIAVTYQYAYVDGTVKNDKYGEYVAIEKVDGNNLKFAGKSKLYVDDCIVDAPELEEGNFLKYTWNPDEGMFAVEVLNVIEDAKFENRNIAKGIYLLDGEEYVFAANGWIAELEGLLKNPAKNKVKETMDIVVDGDLLVYAQSKDSNYTDMADVNAQLVLVLDAGDRFSNGYIHDVYGIKYMTIDGDVEVAEYVNKTGFVQFNTLYGAGTRELDKQTNSWGRLFILHKSGSKVYLEELNNTGDNPNDQLSASTKLLNGYEVYATKELDATKTVKLDGNKVAEGNLFFVRYEDSDGVQYKVMALSELTGGKDANAYAQVLTLPNGAGTRTTIVGGYVAFDLTTATDNGYLYVTNAGTWDGDKVAVTFDDGKEAEITVENLENGKIVLNALYSYRYNVLDDDYTLTMVQAATSGVDFWLTHNMIDFSDDEVYVKKPDGTKVKYALDDEVIAVLNVEINRDSDAEHSSDPMAFAVDNQGIEFVKLADLTDEMVINGDEGSTYTQYTDAIYRAGDLFYVIRYSVMNECQEDASFNQNMLYMQLEKIGIKLW